MRNLMDDKGFPVLLDILSQKRPKGSTSELVTLSKYIHPIPGIVEDKYGNFVVDIGENPHGVLWSCHTDTVHGPREEGRQRIVITTAGILRLGHGETGSCLGADDGTGMWIMLEMIKGNVPGRYVFHYGEESGCIGSGNIKRNRPEVLEGMRFAIAFDRAGTSDVITHQRGDRCCSDNFALSIAKQLPGNYSPCRGVYTDTAEYMGIIPECTNLSVGYYAQHSSRETQNLHHLYRLRDAMLKIDPSQFVCERDPKVKEVSTFRRQGTHSDSYYGFEGWNDIWGNGDTIDYDERFNNFESTSKTPKKGSYQGTEETATDEVERVFGKEDYDNIPFDAHEDPDSGGSSGDGFSGKGNQHRSRKPRKGNSSSQGDRLVEDAKASRIRDQFAPDSPTQPHDVRELVRRYPDEVASTLEQMGLEVMEFWPEILSALGYRVQ